MVELFDDGIYFNVFACFFCGCLLCVVSLVDVAVDFRTHFVVVFVRLCV